MPERDDVKVAVTNAVLSNTGDAAIFQAIREAIQREFRPSVEVEFVVFDANASVTSDLYPEWDVQQQLTVSPPREPARLRSLLQRARHMVVRLLIRHPSGLTGRILQSRFFHRTSFAKSFQALSSADYVISSGGTYLVDHYNFFPRVLEFELAVALGCRPILWTQSLGPFRTERSVADIRRGAQSIDRVYFRDERSSESYKSLGFQTGGPVVPDAVFGLGRVATSPIDRLNPAGTKKNLTAVISVRRWNRGVDSEEMNNSLYVDMLRSAASTLSSSGYGVRALSTCQGVPSYSFDDSREARRIFNGLPVDIDGDFHSPSSLLAQLASCDLVVTTRMHLAILALISGRPTIAIAYEFKTVELFESIGLRRFVINIEDSNAQWMKDTILYVSENPDEARLSDAQLEDLRYRAALPARELASIITSA